MDRPDRRGRSRARSRIRGGLLPVPGQPAGPRRAQRALRPHVRVRQRPSLRRARRSGRGSRSRPVPQPRRPRDRPRRLLQPAPRPDARPPRARGRRAPGRGLARAVPRPGRAPGDRPRADVREQGRGGRRLEPPSPLPDLRDQLRVQAHRDRGPRLRASPGRDGPAALPGDPGGGADGRPPHPLRERAPPWPSCPTSRATPTRSTWRRRPLGPAWTNWVRPKWPTSPRHCAT